MCGIEVCWFYYYCFVWADCTNSQAKLLFSVMIHHEVKTQVMYSSTSAPHVISLFLTQPSDVNCELFENIIGIRKYWLKSPGWLSPSYWIAMVPKHCIDWQNIFVIKCKSAIQCTNPRVSLMYWPNTSRTHCWPLTCWGSLLALCFCSVLWQIAAL